MSFIALCTSVCLVVSNFVMHDSHQLQQHRLVKQQIKNVVQEFCVVQTLDILVTLWFDFSILMSRLCRSWC